MFYKVFKKITFLYMTCIPLLIVSGCALLKDVNPPTYLESISLSLDQDANENSALSIDLLMIYHPNLLEAVMSMTSKDYFSSAAQIKRDYPEMVDIWHWELSPGQTVQDYPIKPYGFGQPIGAVIFADYLCDGDHRVRLGSQEHATVHAKKYDFCVLEQGGCATLPQPKKGSDTPKNKEASKILGKLKDSKKHQDSPDKSRKIFKKMTQTFSKIEKDHDPKFAKDLKEIEKLF